MPTVVVFELLGADVHGAVRVPCLPQQHADAREERYDDQPPDVPDQPKPQEHREERADEAGRAALGHVNGLVLWLARGFIAALGSHVQFLALVLGIPERVDAMHMWFDREVPGRRWRGRAPLKRATAPWVACQVTAPLARANAPHQLHHH